MTQDPQVQALFQRARQAYSQRQFDDCLAACDQLVARVGLREEILNLRGMSLLAKGNALEARKALRQALKRNKRSSGMHLNAARIDLVLADQRGAKRHVLEAVRLDSNDPATLYQAAVACRQCGDYDLALRLANRCSRLAPDLTEAHHLLGSMQLDRGEMDAAGNHLRQALQHNPLHARALADLARLTNQEEAREPLRASLKTVVRQDPDLWNRSAAAFALADLDHGSGNYHEAAGAYQLANELGQRVRPFDLVSWEQKQATTLIRESTLETLGPPGQGPGADLVFLVGMPRSGTSLNEQILGAHSQIRACGELTAMHAIELHSEPDSTIDQLRQRYRSAIPGSGGEETLISDKLPMNFERVGLIHRLFPGARFIHCQRDPMDTIFSCYQQDFQAGVKWAFDLDSITRVLVAERRLMEFWGERLPDHILPMRYEDLVADLPGQAGALATFLELELEPQMLEPHRSNRTVQTASRMQVRESVYATSVKKWRHYESLMETVIPRLNANGIDFE